MSVFIEAGEAAASDSGVPQPPLLAPLPHTCLPFNPIKTPENRTRGFSLAMTVLITLTSQAGPREGQLKGAD